jgi:hypothetical protein
MRYIIYTPHIAFVKPRATAAKPIKGAEMKVKEILTDIKLVIAQIEVELNGELRTSPTLCALIPADGQEPEKIIPLNTPDGRPIFMNIENVIRPLS